MRRFYSFFIVLLLPLTISVSQSLYYQDASAQIRQFRNPVSDTLRTPLAVSYQGYDGDTASAVAGLKAELAAIMPATYYKRMSPSAKIVLFNPDNSVQTLHEVNPFSPVWPASVEKMFTTSTILWALGSKYDFTTKLDIVGTSRVESGSVVGNVYLRPSGDPTLRLADFSRLAEELKARGIRQIEGDIISDLTVDDVLTPDAKRYFAEQNMIMQHQTAGDTLDASLTEDTVIEEDEAEKELSDEEDLPGYFSSSPNFFIDRNMLALRVSGSSRKGAAPSITLYPPINAVRIINKATTSAGVTYRKKRIRVGKGKRARYRTVRQRIGGRYTIHISSSGGENGSQQVITVTGQIPARQDRSLSVPIKDVPLAMAGLLKWKLEQEGIRVAGTARAGTPPKGANLSQTLAEKRTPLLDLLSATNKPSDNFLAEALFRKLSSVADIGSANPRERSERMIRSFLSVINANNVRTVAFADGSGLSRDNHITANCVIELLRGIRSRPEMYSDFCNSLTIAGYDGTLRGRMINTPAHGNAHGKTGTLNGVTALAGYVATKDGQLAGYFITMQNFGGGAAQYKRIQDQIVTKLANFSYAEYTAKYSPAAPAVFENITAPGTER
jgi:serine-type D-Ala-D-Ala carboxypeptidase/endopeptidase (penicillin-binding protein 4)